MVAGLNASELLELALLLVAVGALSGFLAGVFGIGGGAILVPVFYESLRLPRRTALHPDGRRRRTVLESADDLLWPAYTSGGRDFVGAGGADLDSRRVRLCLCRLACGGALSRCRRAAIAVCD